MPSFWLFLAMLVPTGLILLTLNTAANSVVQLGSAQDMRGRVMGLYMLVFLGGAPLGSPLVGWVAEQFGPRMSLLAGGAISAAAAAVIGLLLARRRGVAVRDYAVRPAANWPGWSPDAFSGRAGLCAAARGLCGTARAGPGGWCYE